MSPGHFSDPAAVASYLEGPPRAVPGFAAAHALVDGLLSECVPDDGRVLVLGAGGGLELAHLAGRHDGWRFDGVDPSPAMLGMAATTLGPLASRAELHEGYADDAPEGPYDGATCLLTLHFVPVAERVPTLREIHRRLRPGAPLLTLHHSVPAGDARRTWLERSVRFATGPGAPAEQVARSAGTMAERLALCAPEEDERLLRDAGFSRIAQYFGALTFRGWIAHA